MRLYILSFLLIFFASCNNNSAPEVKTETPERSEKLQDPIRILSDSIAVDSTNAELFVRRAQLYFEEERIGNALSDINQALSLNNKLVEAYLILAEIYYGMGQAESVTTTLAKAVEVAPNDPRPQVKLAELNLLQRNLRMAHAYINKALAMGSYNPEAYYVRGLVFLAQEDTVSAMKNFMLARDQDENFFEAIYQIGVVYTAQRNSLAKDFLKDAIHRFPESVVARYQLALYLQDNEEVEAAMAHYDTLLTMKPDNPMFLYNIGYVHLVYLQEYEKALSYFDAALSIQPNYVDALFNKGRTLEEMEQYASARELYQEVLRQQANYPLAIEGLNRLDRRK
ncbi:MAG: tetratricopeptide repeat protein [Bacteroidetes bacterium]|nr:tetratricopeptide repeat protein [Bacteroidota bacterium]MBU1577884.1 tetratricopeptide repeat protein [Bacteroidota bacterium]MBU2465350.1 tetratricopeptide repeat protein [Bacteroidota bacterium]MBU2556843.1 tetratricopeptide repeat protein [Bacteroidota bacterium]